MLDTLDVGSGLALSWFPILDGNHVDGNILITLPERDEYDMLCTQNCYAPKNNSLKHSTYRAKHWETKDYNHPHHCGGDQDNKSHTMDGNTTRISQIQ